MVKSFVGSVFKVYAVSFRFTNSRIANLTSLKNICLARSPFLLTYLEPALLVQLKFKIFFICHDTS